MAPSTVSRWIRPEVYPLFAAMGVAVGICGFQLIRNICINPEVRSQILMMMPSPTHKQAYSMICNEESQRTIHTSIPEPPVSLYSSSSSASQKLKKPEIVCEHCGIQWHTKDTCYKLHGYPTPSRGNYSRGRGRFGSYRGGRQGRGYNSNSVTHIPHPSNIGNMVQTDSQIAAPLNQAPIFTPQQYQQLMSMMNSKNDSISTPTIQPPTANFASSSIATASQSG